MTFWALFVGGAWMIIFALSLNPNSNFKSWFLFRIIPVALGIWLLWEAALIHLAS